jgi:hypothetical protein
MPETDTLSDALSRVMAAIGRIEKSAKAPAEMGGFKFVPITAVMNALQPALIAERVILLPRVELLRLDEYTTGGGKASHMATVHVQLLARRGTEELLWAEALGQGADTQDKAVGKATTGGVKQALLNALAVPTGDDPDAASTDGPARRAPSAQREEAKAAVRERATLGELRDRVIAVAAKHAIPREILNDLIDSVAEGKSLEKLTAEELIALGVEIRDGRYDIPFESAAGPSEALDAAAVDKPEQATETSRGTSVEPSGSTAPVTQPAEPSPLESPPADTLQAVLNLTGGELVDDAAVSVPAAGDGAGGDPSSSSIPPKPGSDEYKALPSGVERMKARDYWQNREVAGRVPA